MENLTKDVNEMLNDFSEQQAREDKMKKWIDDLPEDKLLEVMKKISPYGVVSNASIGAEETVSMSYTNMRLDFMRKLVMTSMIGFLLRMLKEYNVPDEVPPVEPSEYMRNPALCDPPAFVTDPAALKKYAEFKAGMEERVTIYKFLKHVFDFDPDQHVTSALQTNKNDPSRIVPKSEAIGRALTLRKNTVNTQEKRKEYEATAEQMVLEARNDEEKRAFEMIPSLDTFIRYDRYLEEFYEQYLDTVHTIYGARPDIDFSVIVYDKHKNADEAKRFKERNMNQVIAPITNIKLNKWAILGPYRENREKVDFFNQHTEVLKEMVDARERDSHVAADIMRKRIKNKKAKNIAEAGPDDAEFRKFIKDHKPDIAKMGGEHVTNAAAGDEDANDDPNVVEVNVFSVSEGGRELKVHKIYNPVEAPSAGGGAGAPTSVAERTANVPSQ